MFSFFLLWINERVIVIVNSHTYIHTHSTDAQILFPNLDIKIIQSRRAKKQIFPRIYLKFVQKKQNVMSIVKQLIDYIILNPFGWLFRTLLIQSGIELCIHYGYAIADRIGNLRKVYTPQNLIINVFFMYQRFHHFYVSGSIDVTTVLWFWFGCHVFHWYFHFIC